MNNNYTAKQRMPQKRKMVLLRYCGRIFLTYADWTHKIWQKYMSIVVKSGVCLRIQRTRVFVW